MITQKKMCEKRPVEWACMDGNVKNNEILKVLCDKKSQKNNFLII